MLSAAPTSRISFRDWSQGKHLKAASGVPLIVFHGGARFDAFDTSPAEYEVRQHFGRESWGVRQRLDQFAWTWTGVPHDTKEAAEAARSGLVTVRPAYCTDDLHTAYGYASQAGSEDSEIKPLYLKAEHVLDLREQAVFREWVGDFAGEFNDPARNMAHANYHLRTGGKAMQRAHDAGYDLVIFYDTDVMDRGLHTSYAFFGPDQARLAPSEHGESYYGYPIRQDGMLGGD